MWSTMSYEGQKLMSWCAAEDGEGANAQAALWEENEERIGEDAAAESGAGDEGLGQGPVGDAVWSGAR